MPISPVSSITRQATRKDGEPLNILTFPTHERYETSLAKTGNNFYAFQAEGIKNWTTKYAPIPDNYRLLDRTKGGTQIPLNVDFDLVLSQNKFGQFQLGYQIARQLCLPLVSLEHTLPNPMWPADRVPSMIQMRGDINVFISDYSIGQWEFQRDESVRVIKHCIDSETFSPGEEMGNIGREKRILSVVNDWVNRDWCCGFNIWRRVTEGLPVFPVGDTQGLSRPAENTDELVDFYRDSRIFINTSTISPVPTALLEAMSCGCAVVSTNNCMIPEFIDHGVNGFMTNDENEMREYLELLLKDEELAEKMGQEARKTILEKCSLERFTSEWNDVFLEASSRNVTDRSISV